MHAEHRKKGCDCLSTRPAARQPAAPGATVPCPGRSGVWPTLFTCLVFVLFYVHVAWAVEPRLIYYAHEVPLRSGQSLTLPLFAKGATFFQEFCGRLGGLVQYAAAWACQYYYFRGIGPLVLTAVAWFIFVFGARLHRRFGAANNGLTRYAPLLLLSVIYNQYVFGLQYLLASAPRWPRPTCTCLSPRGTEPGSGPRCFSPVRSCSMSFWADRRCFFPFSAPSWNWHPGGTSSEHFTWRLLSQSH